MPFLFYYYCISLFWFAHSELTIVVKIQFSKNCRIKKTSLNSSASEQQKCAAIPLCLLPTVPCAARCGWHERPFGLEASAKIDWLSPRCCCFHRSELQLMLSLPWDQSMEYSSYHTDNPRGETGVY